ncbi:MAG TPA: hypothetical protein VJ022_06805, partial [Anaerolineales bacterium]|nr:hypothetical protein [Anaerolineales bacterium]
MTDSLKQAEIDQGIRECIEIGDRIAIAETGTFNAKTDSLAVDALGGRSLSVNIFISLALPIEGISQASANTGRHGNSATAFASTFMMNRASLLDKFIFHIFGKEGTNILAAFMLHNGDGSV